MANSISRDDTKAKYQAYKQAAKRLFEDVGPVDSGHIKVPDGATVWMVDGGAFIEATVWVSEEDIKTPNRNLGCTILEG